MLHYLFIDYLIHDLEALDGLLLCDTNISLLQGHRAETTEKKKINMQKVQTRKCVALTESDLLRCQPNMAAYALTFFFCQYPNGIPVVEVEQSLGRIHTQACSHILVVGQCGTEAQQTHILLSQLHIADGPCHQRFQHGSTVIVQQVDFILHNAFTLLSRQFFFYIKSSV